jgi:curved DNA-binding protein CbpA
MYKRDYYHVLELLPNCTSQDVRQNYRRLALKWHPDKNLNKFEAEQRFNEVREAYDVLSDANKKQIYDTYGHKGLEMEQEYGDPTGKRENFFFRKGFQGTEKSAFDILKDIFAEKEDDKFFENYEEYGIPDNFRCDIKNFIEDNIFYDDNQEGNTFFNSYRPTFLDPTFNMSPPVFESMDPNNNCTTNFFSFFATNGGEQSYTRTSTTIFNNGNVTTSTKSVFQNGNRTFEEFETNKYNQKRYPTEPNDNNLYGTYSIIPENNPSLESLFMPNHKANHKDESVILIDEDFKDDSIFSFYEDSGVSTGCSLDDYDRELTSELSMKCKLSSPSKKITKLKDGLNMKLTKKKPSKKCKN